MDDSDQSDSPQKKDILKESEISLIGDLGKPNDASAFLSLIDDQNKSAMKQVDWSQLLDDQTQLPSQMPTNNNTQLPTRAFNSR